MSFTLKYRETSQGSLSAWGTGLYYNYNSELNSLSIAHREKEKTLAKFNFDSHLSKDPLKYITALEKANQIKALMFSNNQTIDLSETLDSMKLGAILKSTARLSRHAYDLETLKLERFCKMFTGEFELKNIKIKKFISGNKENEFFIARIQTFHDNAICVRACTLTGITAAMSDRTIRDLITMEFGHKFESSAHNLLRLSSRLSTLSYILDDEFVPESKLTANSAEEETSATHSKH